MGPVAVLDDRLLIEELLVGLPKRRVELYTTTYWYYRACRAAVLGAGGHLSGPFERVHADQQEAAIVSLLELREDISLPDARSSVPEMARLATRHPRLNLMNLEAAAVGRLLRATVWLSRESAEGVLPSVLDREHVRWRTVTID
ncbi:MAG TPA: hypothetical protein VFP54_00445 [Acidimicrobiales bacterium]|nr:hypothetical protein [Acidimicrobiales bacterium]